MKISYILKHQKFIKHHRFRNEWSIIQQKRRSSGYTGYHNH